MTETPTVQEAPFKVEKLKVRHLGYFMELISAFAKEEALRDQIGNIAFQAQRVASLASAFQEAQKTVDESGSEEAIERRDAIAQDLRGHQAASQAAQNELWMVLLQLASDKGYKALNTFVAKMRGIEVGNIDEEDIELFIDTIDGVMEAENLQSFLQRASALRTKLSTRFLTASSQDTTGDEENSTP